MGYWTLRSVFRSASGIDRLKNRQPDPESDDRHLSRRSNNQQPTTSSTKLFVEDDDDGGENKVEEKI